MATRKKRKAVRKTSKKESRLAPASVLIAGMTGDSNIVYKSRPKRKPKLKSKPKPKLKKKSKGRSPKRGRDGRFVKKTAKAKHLVRRNEGGQFVGWVDRISRTSIRSRTRRSKPPAPARNMLRKMKTHLRSHRDNGESGGSDRGQYDKFRELKRKLYERYTLDENDEQAIYDIEVEVYEIAIEAGWSDELAEAFAKWS